MLSTQAAGGMERLREITITAKTAIRGLKGVISGAGASSTPARSAVLQVLRPAQSGRRRSKKH